MLARAAAVLFLALLTASAIAAPKKEPTTWKARQVAKLVKDKSAVQAAKAAFEATAKRFAELAADGAAAEVQWMPDGRTMALGRNEYRYDKKPMIRELRPNYIAVGDTAHWCFLRKAETVWICESPGHVNPAMVDIDWQAVTEASVVDEPCAETQCLRLNVRGLVAENPQEKPRQRRYFRDTGERAFSVSMLINKADHRPISLLRLDRISALREGSTDLKFDLDAAVAPIELPKNGDSATPF